MKNKQQVEEFNYFCEWEDCEQNQFTDLNEFLSHLREHWSKSVEDAKNEGKELKCQWFGCVEAEFNGPGDFQVHLSYHGFHSKLMSFGLNEMKLISTQLGKNVTCNIDGSTRTVLPPLPDMFVCGWKDCFRIFQEVEDFYRHVERHPFDDGGESPPKRQKGKTSEIAKCLWLDCSSTSNTKSHIRQHLRSHTQEKIIACPNCGAMFSHKNKFSDHLLRQLEDNGPVDQSIIVEINQEQEITLTIHSCETTIQPFRCEQCDKSFHSQSLLREHNRRHFHFYKCDICGQPTSSPSALKHHKTYRHSNDRPFACQFCEAKFKTRSDLRKHIDIHNEDNPFKCSMCSFECRCCHTLNKHMKQLHQSVSNEYLCHECGKNFTRGNNLTRHLISIHQYSLKPHQSRFSYFRDEDGVFKLNQN